MSSASILSKEEFNAFARLAARLSPENLSCDGELSKVEQELEVARIDGQWKELETRAGCGPISVEDIEHEHRIRSRSSRQCGF